MKRALDLLLVAIGLTILAPLWGLIALAIKLEDRGPVFYRQKRWGKDGRTFEAYKFRSMRPNADREWGSVKTLRVDPRITRIGRILRRTALDELPQLINILAGDMSFVGPRALPVEVRQIDDLDGDLPDSQLPRFAERSRARPGLTGITQVFAPRDAPRRKKFRYDLLYVRRQGLRLDLRLLFLSCWITICGKWESEDGFRRPGLKRVYGDRWERVTSKK